MCPATNANAGWRASPEGYGREIGSAAGNLNNLKDKHTFYFTLWQKKSCWWKFLLFFLRLFSQCIKWQLKCCCCCGCCCISCTQPFRFPFTSWFAEIRYICFCCCCIQLFICSFIYFIFYILYFLHANALPFRCAIEVRLILRKIATSSYHHLLINFCFRCRGLRSVWSTVDTCFAVLLQIYA